jgi:hypothetical protein
MPLALDESLLRAAFEPARRLDPTPAEVASVLARAQAGRRALPRSIWLSRQRQVALAVSALALLVTGLYTVPTTRAAIDNLTGTVAEVFSGYRPGDEADEPGRPLRAADAAPSYFNDLAPDGGKFARKPRVLAEAGGYKLYAYIGSSGGINFDLGDTGFGTGFESASEIGPGAVYFLGPGAMRYADHRGHLPLFGLAASSVTSVELAYEHGPPLRRNGIRDGFVLLAEPGREPREIVAYNAAGDALGRKSLGNPRAWLHYARPDRESSSRAVSRSPAG